MRKIFIDGAGGSRKSENMMVKVSSSLLNKKLEKMKNTLIDEDSNVSLTVKLEIPVKDLDRLIEKVVVKTTEIVLTKFENERSPDFIPRKEAIPIRWKDLLSAR